MKAILNILKEIKSERIKSLIKEHEIVTKKYQGRLEKNHRKET